eukprot:2294533-Lingulodinium_polyedra.AAC.1
MRYLYADEISIRRQQLRRLRLRRPLSKLFPPADYNVLRRTAGLGQHSNGHLFIAPLSGVGNAA